MIAESSSGLPVTFDSNDTTRATVSGSTVTIVSGASPGKVGIKATQEVIRIGSRLILRRRSILRRPRVQISISFSMHYLTRMRFHLILI